MTEFLEAYKGIAESLDSLKKENRFRQIPYDSSHRLIDLCSNDYLGLGARSDEFREEFSARFHDADFSSCASRLLSRRQKYHEKLERLLCILYGRPALLFNSGYHANVGCIAALASPKTLFICDKAIHASIIDGLKMGGCQFRRFPHNDIEALGRNLSAHASDFERVVVVVESIYSMDGDTAPLREIVRLKGKYSNMLLYVDEAHAIGVRGELGLGYAEETGLSEFVDILIGTMGKALASSGAFVISNKLMRQFLVNSARPFIFSTALPPVNMAWSFLMLEKSVTMKDERNRLARLAKDFKNLFLAGTVPESVSTQIVPFIAGDASLALEMAARLRNHGYDALAIRRPTVAAGTERIRFSLNALLSIRELAGIPSILLNNRSDR